MSTTDSPPPPTDQGPRISGQEARDLRGLRRTTKASPEGRYIAGVAGGLARHFDIDPVVVRVLLAVLVFFGGAGLLIYGAGWLFIPEEGSEQSTIPLDERNRSLALYVAAGLAALALLGDTIGSFHFPWPLAIIVLVLLAVLGSRDRVKASDWR
ncbi:PspC domain-containing protein, partial [Nocardioides sp. CER28]